MLQMQMLLSFSSIGKSPRTGKAGELRAPKSRRSVSQDTASNSLSTGGCKCEWNEEPKLSFYLDLLSSVPKVQIKLCLKTDKPCLCVLCCWSSLLPKFFLVSYPRAPYGELLRSTGSWNREVQISEDFYFFVGTCLISSSYSLYVEELV